MGTRLPPQLRFHCAIFISCSHMSMGFFALEDGGAPSRRLSEASLGKLLTLDRLLLASSFSRLSSSSSSSMPKQKIFAAFAEWPLPSSASGRPEAASRPDGAASREDAAEEASSKRRRSGASSVLRSTVTQPATRSSGGGVASRSLRRRRAGGGSTAPASPSLASPRPRGRRAPRFLSSSAQRCARIFAISSCSSFRFRLCSSSSCRFRSSACRSCRLEVRREVTVPGTGWSPVPADRA
mmetsp:Transcript_28852/g.80617  ORF Transcript_28852/g.80617 Transcript_28852/m.80617 type:complete len:239 (-) Transcript_28852:62-778(-)